MTLTTADTVPRISEYVWTFRSWIEYWSHFHHIQSWTNCSISILWSSRRWTWETMVYLHWMFLGPSRNSNSNTSELARSIHRRPFCSRLWCINCFCCWTCIYCRTCSSQLSWIPSWNVQQLLVGWQYPCWLDDIRIEFTSQKQLGMESSDCGSVFHASNSNGLHLILPRISKMVDRTRSSRGSRQDLCKISRRWRCKCSNRPSSGTRNCRANACIQRRKSMVGFQRTLQHSCGSI